MTEDTQFDKANNRVTSFRFTPGALKANRPLVDLIEIFAGMKNATATQIAVVWLLAQKPQIVLIPGAAKLERVEEHIGATFLRVILDDLGKLDTTTAVIPNTATGLLQKLSACCFCL